VEKNRLNANWISPQDSEVESNGTHVARTDDPLQNQEKVEDLNLPKARPFKRRRYQNPEMMTDDRSRKNKKPTKN
jgi:hypothetical protein